jgi:3-oxoadipate enol-lactonase
MNIRLKDIQMEYEEKGTGQPLLLIHGFPLSKEMWQPQIDALAKSARVLAPDLRGYGRSGSTRGQYGMDQFAQDCYEFLQEKGVSEPVVLCGLSMGGYISMAFQRLYPDRVAGLVLAATRSAPDSEEGKVKREEMLAVALERGPGAVAEAMLPKMLSPKTYSNRPDLVEQARQVMASASLEGVSGALLGMKERPDSNPSLQKYSGPTLILHGEDDQIIPAAEAEALKNRMQNASLEIIPQAGHLLNLEQPEHFNQAVERFLQSL